VSLDPSGPLEDAGSLMLLLFGRPTCDGLLLQCIVEKPHYEGIAFDHQNVWTFLRCFSAFGSEFWRGCAEAMSQTFVRSSASAGLRQSGICVEFFLVFQSFAAAVRCVLSSQWPYVC